MQIYVELNLFLPSYFMDEHTNCNDANRTEDVVLYSRKENRISMEKNILHGCHTLWMTLCRCCSEKKREKKNEKKNQAFPVQALQQSRDL